MPRDTIDLNGDAWRLGQAPTGAPPEGAGWDELDRVDAWLPATVPGNVHHDLMCAGRLPDPYLGRQNEAAQWVDDQCWWLVRDFTWSPDETPGRRVHLVLRGVDYVADVWLNGQFLARHEGMFSVQTYEVTGLLAAENRLAVRLVGSRWLPANRSSRWEKLLNRLEALPNGTISRFPHRRDTLKCQMSFGWDFAPALRTVGIWDDVMLVASDSVYVRDVAATPRLDGQRAVLAVEVEIDSYEAGPARLCCRLAGETFESEPLRVEAEVDLAAGLARHRLDIVVPEPRLWWPWDHGRPDLYRLSVDVVAASDGRTLDGAEVVVGLREVRLDGLNFYINGERVYARGANWVPADSLPGRVTRADYEALLSMARRANMNMLRVWGGGLREKPAFYELADRLGILIWQEFPLACAFVTRYPRAPEFLRLVEAEVRAIIRDVRNHPSVALWCGGNEFSPERNTPVVQAMSRAAAEDPSRPFWPASPHRLDSHNWLVWHCFEPAAAYRHDFKGFASEFGLQAPPDVATLQRFIPAGELWPPGPSWTYHNAGMNKLNRYARPFLPARNGGLRAFVEAGQRAQAHGLQIGIEHYRRRKAEGCGGALVWQLNEPWPAICWSLIDYYRQPKQAYETARRVFSPMLVSVEYALKRYQAGEAFDAAVWLINDTAQALAGCRLHVELLDEAGRRTDELAQTADVTPDSAERVAELRWTLPAGGHWSLICNLSHDGKVLSENEYDLSAFDGLKPTVGQRVWLWMNQHLAPG